jgi:hypothetical protein
MTTITVKLSTDNDQLAKQLVVDALGEFIYQRSDVRNYMNRRYPEAKYDNTFRLNKSVDVATRVSLASNAEIEVLEGGEA